MLCCVLTAPFCDGHSLWSPSLLFVAKVPNKRTSVSPGPTPTRLQCPTPRRSPHTHTQRPHAHLDRGVQPLMIGRGPLSWENNWGYATGMLTFLGPQALTHSNVERGQVAEGMQYLHSGGPQLLQDERRKLAWCQSRGGCGIAHGDLKAPRGGVD